MGTLTPRACLHTRPQRERERERERGRERERERERGRGRERGGKEEDYSHSHDQQDLLDSRSLGISYDILLSIILSFCFCLSPDHLVLLFALFGLVCYQTVVLLLPYFSNCLDAVLTVKWVM